MPRLFRPSAQLMLWCGACVLFLSLGIRHGFGLFLQPMSLDNGWGREVFAFAIALQNLLWGVAQPFAGAFADRFGTARAVAGGAVLYTCGLLLMAASSTPWLLNLGSGVLLGIGLSGTSFTIVFAGVSRAFPPERRSLAMGICSAIGSLGQFLMVPGSLALISGFGWSVAFLVLAGLAILMLPLAATLTEAPATRRPEGDLTLIGALREAFSHRGYWLLSFGFFVCGFQVVFIAVHLPAFLSDRGLSIEVGTIALALVGLFNVAGTYLAGLWGGRFSKPKLLAGLYAARAVVIVLFVFVLPITSWTAYIFGAAMGFLWLGTVPLTNGTVASIFGVKNMSMLTGVVFLFHQLGAFLGGWLGGSVYDRTGSYDIVWMAAIGLSIAAALLNLPLQERPVARLRLATEAG